MNIQHLNQCKDVPDIIVVSSLKNPDLLLNYTTNSKRHKPSVENIGVWRVVKQHKIFISEKLSGNSQCKTI